MVDGYLKKIKNFLVIMFRDTSFSFADSVIRIKFSYTSNEINPTIIADQIMINFLKKILQVYLKLFFWVGKYAFQAGISYRPVISRIFVNSIVHKLY